MNAKYSKKGIKKTTYQLQNKPKEEVFLNKKFIKKNKESQVPVNSVKPFENSKRNVKKSEHGKSSKQERSKQNTEKEPVQQEAAYDFTDNEIQTPNSEKNFRETDCYFPDNDFEDCPEYSSHKNTKKNFNLMQSKCEITHQLNFLQSSCENTPIGPFFESYEEDVSNHKKLNKNDININKIERQRSVESRQGLLDYNIDRNNDIKKLSILNSESEQRLKLPSAISLKSGFASQVSAKDWKMTSNQKNKSDSHNEISEAIYIDSKSNVVPYVKRNTIKTMGDDTNPNQSGNVYMNKASSNVLMTEFSHQNETLKINSNMLKNQIRQSQNALIGDNLKSLDVFLLDNNKYSKKDIKRNSNSRHNMENKINFDKLNFERQNLNSKLNEHFEKKNMNVINLSENMKGNKSQNKISHISSANYKKAKPTALSALSGQESGKMLKSQIIENSLPFSTKKHTANSFSGQIPLPRVPNDKIIALNDITKQIELSNINNLVFNSDFKPKIGSINDSEVNFNVMNTEESKNGLELGKHANKKSVNFHKPFNMDQNSRNVIILDNMFNTNHNQQDPNLENKKNKSHQQEIHNNTDMPILQNDSNLPMKKTNSLYFQSKNRKNMTTSVEYLAFNHDPNFMLKSLTNNHRKNQKKLDIFIPESFNSQNLVPKSTETRASQKNEIASKSKGMSNKNMQIWSKTENTCNTPMNGVDNVLTTEYNEEKNNANWLKPNFENFISENYRNSANSINHNNQRMNNIVKINKRIDSMNISEVSNDVENILHVKNNGQKWAKSRENLKRFSEISFEKNQEKVEQQVGVDVKNESNNFSKVLNDTNSNNLGYFIQNIPNTKNTQTTMNDSNFNQGTKNINRTFGMEKNLKTFINTISSKKSEKNIIAQGKEKRITVDRSNINTSDNNLNSFGYKPNNFSTEKNSLGRLTVSKSTSQTNLINKSTKIGKYKIVKPKNIFPKKHPVKKQNDTQPNDHLFENFDDVNYNHKSSEDNRAKFYESFSNSDNNSIKKSKSKSRDIRIISARKQAHNNLTITPGFAKIKESRISSYLKDSFRSRTDEHVFKSRDHSAVSKRNSFIDYKDCSFNKSVNLDKSEQSSN